MGECQRAPSSTRIPRTSLLDVAQFTAQQEIHQRDAAGVQRLEVDAGAEHPLAAVAGMAHLPAAQQANPHVRIQQGEVHSGLHVFDLLVVLRIQAIIPAHRQPGRAVAALHPHAIQGRPRRSGGTPAAAGALEESAAAWR